MVLLTSCYNDSPENQPNFILILVDDLGKEWISAYGAEDVVTPEIDHLAETGLRFTNAWSMPQCTPSRVALLTGQYPNVNGWINHYDVPRWGHGARFDPDQYPVVSNQLREGGYRTCAAGKWQINDFRLEPEAMVNAGFDEYFMWTGGEGGNEHISNERYWGPYIHSKNGSKTYLDQFGPDLFSDFIIHFMEENQNNPFLVYYPMVLTHTPFVHTPHDPDVDTKFDKHKAMVGYTDFIVGKIVDALERLNLRENTYLIFTTDNGTTPSIAGRLNGAHIVGGKTYLSENGINAPFIINHPGIIKHGRVTDALIDFTDVFPTLLELADLKYPPDDHAIQGKSFAGVINGKRMDGNKKWTMSMGSHPALINTRGRIQSFFEFRDRAFRNDRYKIYVDTVRQIQRIYDLSSDPFETNNLLSDTSPTIVEVRKEFEEYLSTVSIKDQSPKYKRARNSFWDIPPGKLAQKSKRVNRRKNMLGPLISEEKYMEINY